ncbi:MAG: NAD-dependent protein deacylase [Treponema bryantii]|nr:NAD-dependent protein deacylase [Treponema bryantii]
MNHCNVDILQQLIDKSKNIVFFGGAGVSTESGIPDFRSTDGLYFQKWDFPPEEILSRDFFYKNTAEFYKFYREKFILENIKPNPAHYKLAELEQTGKLKAIVTQNIDGLHQAAGSKIVYELHGTTLNNYCENCHANYDLTFVKQSESAPDKIPHCTKCGAIIKPGIVLYQENLDDDVIEASIDAIQNADTLIVGGTSLVVNPAAGLIRYFRGENLVLINKTPTPMDSAANLIIRDPIGAVFSQIKC